MDLLTHEKQLWQLGINCIAGVDEVGRGALAGPLVAGAVILNACSTQNEAFKEYAQINDSKLLTPKKREILSEFIKQTSVCWAVYEIAPAQIDEWGVAKSTQTVFLGAVEKLAVKPQHILVDAFPIKAVDKKIQTNLKHGDRLSISIAAASIIAKVYRDELMRQYHTVYENYGFDRHKGYGTRRHFEAIALYGPCKIHRFSFSPFRETLGLS